MALNREYELLFGQIVQELGFSSAQAVEDALEFQQSSAREGRDKTLAEILVFLGSIDETKAQEIDKEARARFDTLPEIPGFEVQEKILNRGTLALYIAHQKSVDRQVILKVHHIPRWKDTPAELRFEHEAKLTAKLTHNNILGAIDMGETEEFVFFVLQYPKGGILLSDYLKEHKHIPSRAAVGVALQLAQAVQYICSKNLCHGNLAPDNIFISDEGAVFVAGFELISTIGEALEHPGGISPRYIPPEGREFPTLATELYSLGCTLFEITTGANPQDLPPQDMSNPALPPIASKVNIMLNRGLSAIIYTLMQPEPRNRYLDLESLVSDLEAITHGEKPVNALEFPGIISRMPKISVWPVTALGRYILYGASLAVSFILAGIYLYSTSTPKEMPLELLSKDHWQDGYRASNSSAEIRSLWYKGLMEDARSQYKDDTIINSYYREILKEYPDSAYADFIRHKSTEK